MTEDLQKSAQRLAQEQQMVEANLDMLKQRLEQVGAIIGDYQAGLDVLEEIESRDDDKPMLMNIGGGILVEAQIVDRKSVTRNIRSGILIKQSIEDAKSAIQDSLKSIGEHREELVQEYQKMAAYAAQINTQLQSIVAQLQGQGGQ